MYDSEVETLIVCPAGRTGTFEIPEGITYIEWCERLTTITLPASLTEIGNNAFSWCDLLTEIYFRGTLEQWESITIEGENDGLTQAEVYCESNEEAEKENETARIKNAVNVFLNDFVAHAYYDENYLFKATGDAYTEKDRIGRSSHEAFWFVLLPLHRVLYRENSDQFLEEGIPLLNTNRSCELSDEEWERIKNDPYVSQWIDSFEQYYERDVAVVLDKLYGKGRVSPADYFGREGFVTDDGYLLIPSRPSDEFPMSFYNYYVHDIQLSDNGIIKATISCALIEPDFIHGEIDVEPVAGSYRVFDLITNELVEEGIDDSLENFDRDYYEFARQYEQDESFTRFEIELFEDDTGIHIYLPGHDKKESESSIVPQAEVGDIISFGSYEQDNNVSNGPEPIEWIVLSSFQGKILVISKYVLDSKPIYREDYANGTWEEKGNWESCFLRAWLNDTFFNTDFSVKELKYISSTNVTSDWNPDWDSWQGNDTKDKIFLLSAIEADVYFDSDESRKCIPTAYAIAQGDDNDKYKSMSAGEPCWWWLRTAGPKYSFADCIINGMIDTAGIRWGRDDIGVRPALWLDIE